MHPTAFLEGYTGQDTDELLALADRYRLDSIVLAFEQGLQARRDAGATLTRAETYVLAVEAYEREVNNGGAEQFFVNGSVEFAPVIVEALRAIGCTRSAEFMQEALDVLVPDGPVTAAACEAAVIELSEEARAALSRCDDAFFGAGEPIAENLFDWTRQHRDEIHLGHH